MRELVRKHIRELVPYKSARSEFKGEAEVYLDANGIHMTFNSIDIQIHINKSLKKD